MKNLNFHQKFECNFGFYQQWNLSTADMLYSGRITIVETFSGIQLFQVMVKLLYYESLCSGHLSIADTFFRNQLSQATVKLLYFEPLYSGHLSIADTFSENQWCPLLRGFTVFSKSIRMFTIERSNEFTPLLGGP